MEARSLETIVETFSYQRKMETLVTVLPDLGHYCRSATEQTDASVDNLGLVARRVLALKVPAYIKEDDRVTLEFLL